MKFVDPYEQVTLLLDRAYLPFQIATAKAIFYHILKEHGHGIDAEGKFIKYEDLVNGTMSVYPDQPCMRSADRVWPIPTIFVVNQSFFFKRRKKNGNDTASLRELYRHYKGVCQYCLKKKPFEEFSKDHIFPRSKGGTDHAHNLTLACKTCNSIKGSEYPYKNVRGEYVKFTKMYSTGLFRPDEEKIRPEWRVPLFMEAAK